jgi:hypothetical protein
MKLLMMVMAFGGTIYLLALLAWHKVEERHSQEQIKDRSDGLFIAPYQM